jgi:flagella basal body P-ring formation protein FlgA
MIRLTSMLLTLLTVAAIATGAAAGLTEVRLKRDIIISGAKIRLGDLFENAGLLANKIVGKAPAPGARTVYGSRQVSALARANGLVWRPRGRQPFIAVRRAGRRVPREVVLRELGQALIDAGAGEGLQIEQIGRAHV